MQEIRFIIYFKSKLYKYCVRRSTHPRSVSDSRGACTVSVPSSASPTPPSGITKAAADTHNGSLQILLLYIISHITGVCKSHGVPTFQGSYGCAVKAEHVGLAVSHFLHDLRPRQEFEVSFTQKVTGITVLHSIDMGAKTYNEVVSVLRSYGLDTTVYESDKLTDIS